MLPPIAPKTTVIRHVRVPNASQVFTRQTVPCLPMIIPCSPSSISKRFQVCVPTRMPLPIDLFSPLPEEARDLGKLVARIEYADNDTFECLYVFEKYVCGWLREYKDSTKDTLVLRARLKKLLYYDDGKITHAGRNCDYLFLNQLHTSRLSQQVGCFVLKHKRLSCKDQVSIPMHWQVVAIGGCSEQSLNCHLYIFAKHNDRHAIGFWALSRKRVQKRKPARFEFDDQRVFEDVNVTSMYCLEKSFLIHAGTSIILKDKHKPAICALNVVSGCLVETRIEFPFPEDFCDFVVYEDSIFVLNTRGEIQAESVP